MICFGINFYCAVTKLKRLRGLGTFYSALKSVNFDLRFDPDSMRLWNSL